MRSISIKNMKWRSGTLNIIIRETVVIRETRQGTCSAKLNYKKRLEKQETVVRRETVVIVETRPGAFPAVSLITMFGVLIPYPRFARIY